MSLKPGQKYIYQTASQFSRQLVRVEEIVTYSSSHLEDKPYTEVQFRFLSNGDYGAIGISQFFKKCKVPTLTEKILYNVTTPSEVADEV